MRRTRVEVAIVGAGPVGLTLACLLQQQGISFGLYERRRELHRQPQAHVINMRTLEIFRQLGIDRKVAAAGAPLARMRYINWVQSLAGREFGRLSLMGANPEGMIERLSYSPTMVVNLAQNRLEPILHERLQQLGGAVHFNATMVSAHSGDTSASLTIMDPVGQETTVTADYVVACDGAGSAVRRGLGIEMMGPSSLQKFINIYFTANLDRVLGGRHGPVHWIIGPDVRAVLIGFDLARVWALMVPFGDPDHADDYTPEVARNLVAKAIGDPTIPFEITSIGNWNMSAQVAEAYGAGRIFLAGDAAHRFPPSGGLGLNTGVQDAHNLAWKLAAVLKGHADAALLETYQSERQPIAQVNCEQSLMNSMKMGAVDDVLGASSLAPVRPSDAFATVTVIPDLGFGGDGDGDGPQVHAKRAEVQDAINQQAEHFDSLGIDMGVTYEVGAFVHDGSAPVANSVQTYFPNTRPGARMPHAWLTKAGRRVSTLDLISSNGFTLMISDTGTQWRSGVSEVARLTGQFIAVISIGPEGDYQDPHAQWRNAGGPQGEGAILVRADGHVAWRTITAVNDPTSELCSAINHILCKSFAPASELVA
jgi:2,4-dichlorophenol 6-monooxygenase